MPNRRQSRHAFKPTTAKGNLFGLLPPELRKEIIDKVRKDRLGNETVPGHVAGAQLRGTCKEMRDDSDALPSEFDGEWYCTEYQPNVGDGILTAISAFKGGKRFSPRQKDAREPNMRTRQLYLVRKPSTGALKAIATWDINGTHQSMKMRYFTLSLRGLAEMLSSHNAEFDKRLNKFDEVTSGKEMRVPATEVAASLERQSIDGSHLVAMGFGGGGCAINYRSIDSNVFTAYKVDRVDPPSGTGAVKHVLSPTILMKTSMYGHHPQVMIEVPVDLDEGAPDEPLNVYRTVADQKRGTLSPLSVVFGYYDDPHVAECRHMGHHEPIAKTWLTSLYRVPAGLDQPTESDPSRGLRERGNRALLSVEEWEMPTEHDAGGGQLVVHRSRTPEEEAEHERRVAFFKKGGPVAAAVARPRASAEDARAKMKPLIAADNVTFKSGRLFAHTQPWDSREAEANGEVDDQYATARAEGESAGEATEDEEDTEYVPKKRPRGAAPEPKAPMNKAHLAALRRLIAVSDDDDDDPPVAEESFRDKGKRLLGGFLEF